jgi:inner membrane transporter RhtA
MLVLAAIVSVQVGSAVAKGELFDELGASAVVLLRLGFGALMLGLLWPPRPGRHAASDLRLVALFAATLAGMNLSFYAALDRVPLGVAVTVEFAGPLAVAVGTSRRRLDLVWAALAAAGILLLAEAGRGDLDAVGLGFALLAAAFWAAYILLSARVGAAFSGMSGLALAMVPAAALAAPFGVVGGGTALLDPWLLAGGAVVAVLSSVVPWSFELAALRRMPTSTFGILMSLEPPAAALAGVVILDEELGVRLLAAIALVVVASIGATATKAAPRPAGRRAEGS